jgi:PAS domain S-box-containing protein
MPTPIDFARIFEIAPNAFMVLDRDLRYVAANAAYLEVTASTRETLIGKHLFELFPNDPTDPNNEPATMLRRSLERVLETGQRDHLAFIRYRVPQLVDGQVVTVDRVWSATHSPVLDEQGRVALILQHTVDVTELERLRRQADATGRDMRMEAGVLLRAQAVQQEKELADRERENLRVLFAQAPGFMAVLEGENHVFRLANDAYRKIVGNREVLGKPVRDALPEVVEQGFVAILDRVLQTGEPFIGRGVVVNLRRAENTFEDIVLDFIYQPVRGADGRVTGIFVQGHDVTETKRAEEQREAARRAAEAFSEELQQQSREVIAALQQAKQRIAELEAALAAR